MVLGWIYKFLHSKRNFKQNKKPSHEMGENICKWYTDGINFQNVHTSQDQKTKNPIKIKWAEDTNRYFSQEDIQMAKGKWKNSQNH